MAMRQFFMGDARISVAGGTTSKGLRALDGTTLRGLGLDNLTFVACFKPLDKAIEEICCKIKAEKELDIKEEINKAIEALFDLIKDADIDQLVGKLPKELEAIKKPLGDFLKGLKGDAKDAIKGGVPDFVIRFKPCPGKCGEKGDCTVFGQKKFPIELKKKLIAKPLGDLLEKILGSGEIGKAGKKVIDAVVDLVPVAAFLIIQPIVDILFNCEKKCVERATLRMFIGLQGKAEGLGLTLAIGFGLDALVDLTSGQLKEDAVLKLGNGDVDEKGESGSVTYNGFFPKTIKQKIGTPPLETEIEVPNPLRVVLPEELFDKELDFLEGLGWKKEDRKQAFALSGSKGTAIAGLDLLTPCEKK